MATSAPLVLIFTASIGEGHDGPARRLAEEVGELEPGAVVETVDFLALVPLVGTIAVRGSSFHSRLGSRAFDAVFWLIDELAPVRWLVTRVLCVLSFKRMRRRIEASAPDVIVSTYPGTTIVIGELRRRGLLPVPCVAAITDLAALTTWAHPDVDLHLITHPESLAEVRGLAPASEITCVRGLTSAGFEREIDPLTARRSLGLAVSGPVVVVSGGGWAVGDLEGAVEAALAVEGATVVCLCGRNEEALARVTARFEGEARVVPLGFTDRISELFAAADVLVHSTAGLTVLEALMRGCRVISYGWGHGHVRVNNHAFTRFGLAAVAGDPRELRAALRHAVDAPRAPDHSFAELPSAAVAVTTLARARSSPG